MSSGMYADEMVVVQPGQRVIGKTGQKLVIKILSPHCLVDSHVHIENGACTPLPLLWDKNWLIAGKTREKIDKASSKGILGWIAGMAIGEGGKIQVKDTKAIGDLAVAYNKVTFYPFSTIGESDLYRNRDFFSPMIVMPMDMEYAHIAGYDGQTIYHDDDILFYESEPL